MTFSATELLRNAIIGRSRSQLVTAIFMGANLDDTDTAYFPLAFLAEFPHEADEQGDQTWGLLGDLLRSGARGDRTYQTQRGVEVGPDQALPWDRPYRAHPYHRHLASAFDASFHERPMKVADWLPDLQAWGKTAVTARSDIYTSSLACLRAYLDLGQARQLATPQTWQLAAAVVGEWLSQGLALESLQALAPAHLADPAMAPVAQARQAWVRSQRLAQAPATAVRAGPRRRA